MANRFWVGGTANWDTTAGTKWSTTSGGAGGSAVPTSADDVFFDGNSGTPTVTMSVSRPCRSLNFTGFLGTFITSASTVLTIGDATAGASSVALKLNSSMTYTVGSSSTITFNSTSATLQTITLAGKIVGSVTFATAGNWAYTDAISANGITLNRGTLHLDGVSDNSGLTHTFSSINSSSNLTSRTLNLGNATINLTSTGTPLTFNTSASLLTFIAGTSTINITGAGGNQTPALIGGAKNFYTVNFTGSGQPIIITVNSFVNLSRTTTGLRTDGLFILGNFSVTGSLTLTGTDSANRLYFKTNSPGSIRTITVTGATVTTSYTDFRDIILSPSVDLSGSVGGVGDLCGNGGITFTTPQTNYWVGNGGSWTDSSHWANSSGGTGGTGRVPLGQDTARFDSNSFTLTGQTVSCDMHRIAKDIIFTGVTNNPTFNLLGASTGTISNNQSEIFGSLTLDPNMTYNGNPGGIFFESRSGNISLFSAGHVFSGFVAIEAISGVFQLLDDFNSTDTSSGFALFLVSGELDANDFNVTTPKFFGSGTVLRTIRMGSGTWNLTGTGTVWDISTNTNLTIVPETSTIVVSNTSSSNKTFAGAGKTYNNITVSGGGSGTFILTGANTFNTFTLNAPKTVTLPASTTQIISSFVAYGTSGNLITIQSSSSGSQATLSQVSGIVSCNYLSLKDNNVTGGASWYAGSSSINVSNNSGWQFIDYVFSENLNILIESVFSLIDTLLPPRIRKLIHIKRRKYVKLNVKRTQPIKIKIKRKRY